ncbi:MAG: hypothetical protein ACOYYS_17640 [Chloroflexota bacterium]
MSVKRSQSDAICLTGRMRLYNRDGRYPIICPLSYPPPIMAASNIECDDFDPVNYTPASELIGFVNYDSLFKGRWTAGYGSTTTDEGDFNDDVSAWFAQSQYAISGVKISGSRGTVLRQGGTPHWIVITGISQQWEPSETSPWNWVRIYNPFDNDTEYYWWNYFRASFDGGEVAVLTPTSFKPSLQCWPTP